MSDEGDKTTSRRINDCDIKHAFERGPSQRVCLKVVVPGKDIVPGRWLSDYQC